jgi:outer membrane receptor protein involved in Fe transport
MFKNATRVRLYMSLAPVVLAALVAPALFGQETTAGIQGTVKDASGAVIPNSTVEVTSAALIGVKTAQTDQGHYRFVNLPVGTYTLTVTATGFRTYKQANIPLDAGRLPTVDVNMEVGTMTETVDVSANAANVDVTQSKVQANIPAQGLMDLPTQSLSFQSVIQFAPGSRSEPLQGGYQVNGASNSENSYLVEGQETASLIDGHSNANVPMDFIQEVQVKTNGFEAEYGGALGGVVNVISKRGSNEWHGSIFTYYNSDRFNAAPSPSQIKNPQFAANYNGNVRIDQPMEYYYPDKDHSRVVDPGFTLGGDLIKDRLWAFVSAAPDFNNLARTVNFTFPGAVGPRTFHDTNNTYYSVARLDFLATQKIRLFGSWQYNYARGTGTSLPGADEVHNQFNTSSTQNPDIYNSSIGYVAPNLLYNTGADVTISPTVVATTRFGYFAYNYEDRGKPTGIQYTYRDTNYPYATGNAPALSGTKALNGAVLPTAYVNSAGYTNIGGNSQTQFDLWQRYSFNQDLSFFKPWHGTHNFKVGYGFMHGTDNTLVGYNTADVYVAFNVQYLPTTVGGKANCKNIVGQNLGLYGVAGGNADGTACQGNWGTVNVRDVSTGGKVGGWNHSFYVQDAWTVAKYLTLNLGVRLDKENLPSYDTTTGYQGVSFGWGQKVAPRLGAAYDLLHNGKVKLYGSFGYFFDIMKYNLPQGSFGGQYWHDCVYALDDPNYFNIVPQRDMSTNHTPYCPATGGGSPATGQIPNARFIENVDYREPANAPSQIGSLGATGLIDPNLSPMKQHVTTIGAAWEIGRSWVFEPIYTRSRLDRTIEDSGVITSDGEIYYIVNPGFGVNTAVPNCSGCPKNPKAVRNYDGLELRATRRFARDWFGSFSYTYSRLYGNYSGLTATDVSDGVGRNGANTDRAFDEPFMSFDAHGKAIDGPLGTDRPHTVKINAFYTPQFGKFRPSIGIFQQVYSGTPLSSYESVAGAPVFVEGRGKFVNITRDPTTGNFVSGTVTDARTPHFAQTDLSAFQDFHVHATNEKMVVRVGAECTNCLNQHHVTIINQNMLRTGTITPYKCSTAGSNCSGVTDTQAGFAYASVLKGYDYLALSNSTALTVNSLYGSPQAWQAKRSLRFQVRFTF